MMRHPFYGFVDNSPGNFLNALPPRQRREDTVVIGLLGGSVAEQVKPYFQRELNRWFAANQLPRRPAVSELAGGNVKQPQQTIIVANNLLLGGEFDLIVNLDGVNEATAIQGRLEGIFPFFPLSWHNWVELTAEEVLLAGQIRVLRREQARLRAVATKSPLRWSAVFGLANRYQRERTAAAIIQRNHQLAGAESAYRLEKHGPRSGLEKDLELSAAAARVWYRSSVTLSRLAELAGADYYHFLQPNQYVPGSKPLSPEELTSAYRQGAGYQPVVALGYPQLREFNRALQGQGVNYFDLTGIFAGHPETLYIDDCCHLNERGNELLAAAMVQRMEPALRRRGAASPAAPISALAAGRSPDAALNQLRAIYAALADAEPIARADFDLYILDNRLIYLRESCTAADTAGRFFLHLFPAAADLLDWPPVAPENRDFDFARWGGHFDGKCLAAVPLPDYPIKEIRTGQYGPGL